MTILNGEGDVTIERDAANDEQVRRWAEASMARGVVFFLLSPDPEPDQIRLREGAFSRALDRRKLVLFGGSLDAMAELGAVRPVGGPAASGHAEIVALRRAADAGEVVANPTVAARRAVGG